MNIYNYISGIREREFMAVSILGSITAAAATLPPSIVPLAAAATVPLASRAYQWISKGSLPKVQLASIRETPSLEEHRKSEFCRRIPDSEWEAILDQIDQLNHQITKDELHALRFGNWRSPLFKKNDWIYLAFRAFLKNDISQDRMSLLFLYHACQRQAIQDFNFEYAYRDKSICEKAFPSWYPSPSDRLTTFQLFSQDGQVNEAASQLLKQTSRLSPDSFERFVQLAEGLPPEQTQFFLIQKRKNDQLLDSIISRYGAHLRRLIPSDTSQIVMSPDFGTLIHVALYEKNTMRPIPVLGFSNREKFSDPQKRVVGIPSFAKWPAKMDGAYCSHLGAYYHDMFFHLLMESANPHREIWIALAKYFKTKDISFAVPLILDRELYYYQYSEYSDEEKFWIGISQMYSNIGQNGIPLKLFKDFEQVFIKTVSEFYKEQMGLFDPDLAALQQVFESPPNKLTRLDKKLLGQIYKELVDPLPEKSGTPSRS